MRTDQGAAGHLPAGCEQLPDYRPVRVPQSPGLPVLDAWYAAHPDPLMAVGDRPELVFGADDRVRVQDTSAAPYRWVALLEITAADGTTWRGTGWLASSRVVVTAGHCVYLSDQGGWPASITIRLGADTGPDGTVIAPFAPQVSTDFRSVAGWVTGQSDSHDYGCVVLPVGVDDDHGWFAYAAQDDADLDQEWLNIDGYPADKTIIGQWFAGRQLTGLTATTLQYDTDTYGGQSGAPIYIRAPQDRTVVGVHSRGMLTTNQGIRITPAVQATLDSWVQQAAASG